MGFTISVLMIYFLAFILLLFKPKKLKETQNKIDGNINIIIKRFKSNQSK